MKKKIFIGIAVVLVVIQFFRIDKSEPESSPEADILLVESVPSDIGIILKTSCYDCHSNKTIYPWYSNVAPVSWWLKSHVNEGRKELNFSEWSTYSDRRKDHKLEEINELVSEDEMPLASYLWVHGEARLSNEEKDQLINWVNTLRKGEKIENK